jgi:hypothetical protein
VTVQIGGYLKSLAKDASDQGVCGGDMSPPNGTCETRNIKSGSEKRMVAGHVDDITSGAGGDTAVDNVSSPKPKACCVYSEDIENRA